MNTDQLLIAAKVFTSTGNAGPQLIQNRLRIGYNAAREIIDTLVAKQVIQQIPHSGQYQAITRDTEQIKQLLK